MISLGITKRTDPRLLSLMPKHYSAPKGFVGRSICYAVSFEGVYYGHIVSGSSGLHLPGRAEFFGDFNLNEVIANIFFHIEKQFGSYPIRNFSTKVVSEWRKRSSDWTEKYGDRVIGYETLIELPRTGECYRRDGWSEIGKTKGYTCKRGPGEGTDSWSGARVWDTKNLRPKLVLARRV